MKPTFKIRLPEPCAQPWDEMTPTKGGRHCAACSQTITDFRHMTDAQILETLKNTVGGCGRYRANQLDRVLITPPAQRRFSFASFYKIAASLLFVFSAGKAAAQGRISKVPAQAADAQTTGAFISGTITNANGVGAKNMQLLLSGKNIGVRTGADGQFKMKLPRGLTKDSVFTLTLVLDSLSSGENFYIHPQQVPYQFSFVQKKEGGEAVKVSRYEDLPRETETSGEQRVLQAKDIEKMGMWDYSDTVTTTSGVYPGRGSGLSIGNSRTENTVYIIDGVLQTGSRTQIPPKQKKWWQFWKRKTKHNK